MLDLEDSVHKMEEKSLGEMVFAAERITKKVLKYFVLKTKNNQNLAETKSRQDGARIPGKVEGLESQVQHLGARGEYPGRPADPNI